MGGGQPDAVGCGRATTAMAAPGSFVGYCERWGRQGRVSRYGLIVAPPRSMVHKEDGTIDIGLTLCWVPLMVECPASVAYHNCQNLTP